MPSRCSGILLVQVISCETHQGDLASDGLISVLKPAESSGLGRWVWRTVVTTPASWVWSKVVGSRIDNNTRFVVPKLLQVHL